MKEISLDNSKIGDILLMKRILNNLSIKRRFLDIGLTPGTTIEKVLESFDGNLGAYMIRGAVIAIRNEDAFDIDVDYKGEG